MYIYRFKTLHPEPSWATKTIDVAASKEEEGLLRHSKLLEGKEERQRLMPDAIDIVRLKDANIADRSQVRRHWTTCPHRDVNPLTPVMKSSV